MKDEEKTDGLYDFCRLNHKIQNGFASNSLAHHWKYQRIGLAETDLESYLIIAITSFSFELKRTCSADSNNKYQMNKKKKKAIKPMYSCVKRGGDGEKTKGGWLGHFRRKLKEIKDEFKKNRRNPHAKWKGKYEIYLLFCFPRIKI